MMKSHPKPPTEIIPHVVTTGPMWNNTFIYVTHHTYRQKNNNTWKFPVIDT